MFHTLESQNGNQNLLLDLQIFTILSGSIRNITAQIIIAARVAFGKYFTSKQVIIINTKDPVTIHPTVVLTPLAWFNAVREKDDVTGMALVKEQARLHIPKARSS